MGLSKCQPRLEVLQGGKRMGMSEIRIARALYIMVASDSRYTINPSNRSYYGSTLLKKEGSCQQSNQNCCVIEHTLKFLLEFSCVVFILNFQNEVNSDVGFCSSKCCKNSKDDCDESDGLHTTGFVNEFWRLSRVKWINDRDGQSIPKRIADPISIECSDGGCESFKGDNRRNMDVEKKETRHEGWKVQ